MSMPTVVKGEWGEITRDDLAVDLHVAWLRALDGTGSELAGVRCEPPAPAWRHVADRAIELLLENKNLSDGVGN